MNFRMADRSVAIKLTANVQGLVAGLKTGQKAAEDFASKGLDKIGKHEQSINTLSNNVGVLGLALTGLATLAVRAFADFDAAMSSVQASTMESAGNMELLRDAALEAGARTAFSATEAAAAIEELAKAGVSTADILGGGLDGALDLAAAGGIEVADAAEIAASAMTQFGLAGSDVTHVADLLAAGAGKAQGGVTDLGAALNQSGLVASQMGLSVEETVGSLTAFASAGLVGSDAGTSFRSMLLRLANPTKESAELMQQLGINAYDAGGEFVGMEALAGQLQERLGGLSQEQRNAALAQIFGQDAIRTSAILYEQGAEGVREWTTAVDEQGYAAEVAAMRLDNLNGDLEALRGSFETALIGMGESADGPLRSVVQGATDAINKFSEMPPAVQGATMAIVGGGGLVLLGVAGLGKLAIGVNDTVGALKEMGAISEGTGKKVSGMAVGLGKAAAGAAALFAVGAALSAISDAQAPAVAGIEATTSALLDLDAAAGMESIDALFADFARTGTLFGEAQGSVVDFQSALDSLLGQKDPIEGFFSSIFGYETEASKSAEQFEQIGNSLAALVGSGNADLAAEQFEALAAQTEAAGYSTDDLLRLMPSYSEALAGAENGAALAADSQDDLAGSTEVTTTALEDQTAAVDDLIEGQAELAGIVLSERDAQVQLEAAVAGVNESIEKQITDLAAQYEANGLGAEAARARAEAEVAVADKLDITTEAGRNNRTALDDVASAGWDLITSMRENGATQEELHGVMSTTRQRFVDAAGAMGLSADEANLLADELNLIPENVNTNVTADTSQALTAAQKLWDKYNGKSMTVYIDAVSRNTAGGGGGRSQIFASGGFTGHGGKYEPAGIVHRGEFVMDQEKTAMWRPVLEAMHRGDSIPQFFSGGMVGHAPTTSPMAGARSVELHVHNEGRRDVTPADLHYAIRRAEVLDPAW